MSARYYDQLLERVGIEKNAIDHDAELSNLLSGPFALGSVDDFTPIIPDSGIDDMLVWGFLGMRRPGFGMRILRTWQQ